MKRVKLLKEMVKYRDVKDDEILDKYYEAWEELSLVFYEDKSTLSMEEAILLLKSFSDKREYPYLKDMLVYAIVKYVKETGDIDTFMGGIVNNKDGFYESLWALYFLLAFYPEFKKSVKSYLTKIDKQTKHDMLSMFKEYPSYELDKDLMELL